MNFDVRSPGNKSTRDRTLNKSYLNHQAYLFLLRVFPTY